MTSKDTDTSTKVAVRRRNESISSESPTNVLETLLTLPVTETSPPPPPPPTPPTTASYNGKIKHVVLIETSPQDEDSGISESASEELTLVSEGHKEEVSIKDKDGLCRRFFQIFFPFLIAGAGMMLAGMLLDYVQVCLHELREHITSSLSLSLSLSMAAS